MTKTLGYQDAYPEENLPRFRWLKVIARAGEADFGLTNRAELVVSDEALKALRLGGRLNQLGIAGYDPRKSSGADDGTIPKPTRRN